MYINVKISNGKKLQLKTLINLECIHTGIDKQLVKKEQIKTKIMDKLFKILNINRTKNEEVTKFISLELEINGYMK